MTKLGSRELHICPKVTKMGSIIGTIDSNVVGGSQRPAADTQQKFIQFPPPLPPGYLRQIKDQIIRDALDGLCTRQQRMMPNFIIELTGKDY